MEKPILFSSEMIQAILENRKTQTRRVITPQFDYVWGRGVRNSNPGYYSVNVDIKNNDGTWKWLKCPYGKLNCALWVRETHHIDWYPEGVLDCHGKPGIVHYKANGDTVSQSWAGQWRPSIFMPRWASRITLNVLGVRVERLQDIGHDDALAEGVNFDKYNDYRTGSIFVDAFAELWDKINAKRGYSWQSNPWVWVVEFEVAGGRPANNGMHATAQPNLFTQGYLINDVDSGGA